LRLQEFLRNISVGINRQSNRSSNGSLGSKGSPECGTHFRSQMLKKSIG
jgi:hypothetical protein